MIFDDLDELSAANTKIKVIGVGGAGKNAIDHMIENLVSGVEFWAVNTDAQDLKISKAPNKLLIGRTTTHGQGAGANPEVGRAAAIENEDDIHEMIGDAQMVFVTCGMGGGTGTGAAPLIAKVAREHNCLTIGICTKPFAFEGPSREENAAHGLEEIRQYTDTLIIVPNEKLLKILPTGTPILKAFREADNVLRQGVQGIAETIMLPSLINIDFADISTVMRNKGTSLIGIGAATGPDRAVKAARDAISSALLEVSIDGATDAIVNVTSSEELSLTEVNAAIEEIRNHSGHNINIIFGTTFNRDLKDELIVTVIATGYEMKAAQTGFSLIQETFFRNNKEDQIRFTADINEDPFDDNSGLKAQTFADDDSYNSDARVDELFGNEKKEEKKKKWSLFGRKKKDEPSIDLDLDDYDDKPKVATKSQPKQESNSEFPDWLTREDN